MNLNFEKQHRESLSQRARSSPGVLRSGPMRHDALRGLTRQYRLMNGFMNPGWTAPSQAHLSPFELQRKPKKGDRSTSEIFFYLRSRLPVRGRRLILPRRARGSRDGRAKVDPRQDSRQGAQARGRGHATTGANRPPSSLPDPMQPSPRSTLTFRPATPIVPAGRRCSFGCARER